jgi:hypothetical protein
VDDQGGGGLAGELPRFGENESDGLAPILPFFLGQDRLVGFREAYLVFTRQILGPEHHHRRIKGEGGIRIDGENPSPGALGKADRRVETTLRFRKVVDVPRLAPKMPD